MRRAAAAATGLLTLALAGPALAADDYPTCSGDLSAADVQAKGGPALRVGITSRVQAGQVGPTPAAAKPEVPAKHEAALAKLRPPGKPFVVRLNRFFWSEGEKAFEEFLGEARRYTRLGYLVELQVRYHPNAEQEGDIAAWTRHVRDVVDRFGAIPGVVGLQIANEVNFDFSADSSDGAYEGGRDALVQGVIAAKDEVRKTGFEQLEIGFNWAYRYDPSHEQAFWDHLKAGGPAFVSSLDWVGLDAYPGTFFPPAEATPEDYRDGMVNAMSSFRCYLRAAGIPDTVPIHLEENGWPTYGTRREDMQALVAENMIRATHDYRGTYNVSDYRWFNLRDANTSDPQIGQRYGLLRDDYTEKPAFAVVAKLFAELGSSESPPISAARCVARTGRAGERGIGSVRIGMSRASVLRRLGVPESQTARVTRWCVRGGGRLVAAFSKRGRLGLVGSTSLGTRIGRVRVGSSLRAVKRAFKSGYYVRKPSVIGARRGSRIVFGACECGSVEFIAVTARKPARIRYWIKRAGL